MNKHILKLRQKLQLDTRIGYLGNGSGEVHDRRFPGRYFVRFAQANGTYTAPVSIPANANINLPTTDGLPIDVGYDASGQMVIIRANTTAMIESGYNPLQLNPLDGQADYFVNQNQITTFYATRHPDLDNKPFYAVVYPGFYTNAAGDIVFFSGSEIDLSGFQPSIPDHCYVVVFRKDDATLEAFASTAMNVSDPLTITDIQECLDAATADSERIWAWELRHDDTALTVDSSRMVDLRSSLADTAGFYGGNVKSVALSASPASVFNVGGSPITVSGTLTLSMDNQNANTVLAGPSSGAAAEPAFRTFGHSELTGLTTGDDHTQYLLRQPSANWSIDASALRMGAIGGAAIAAQKLTVYTGADANKGLQIRQNNATQSANLLELANSSGTAISFFNSRGALTINSTTTTGTTGSLVATQAMTNPASNVYVFNSLTGTVALSGNAAGAQDFYAIAATIQTANDSIVYSTGQLRAFGLIITHNGSGTISAAYAGYANIVNAGTGTMSIFGYYPQIRNTGAGNIPSATGFYVPSPIVSAGSITTLTGLYVSDLTVASINYAIRTNAGNVVFNEGGDPNTDFRVEGDTLISLLHVDASADSVGINTASPGALLDINGFYRWAGQKRVTSQFDKTDTTLTNITGLSVTVATGKTYYFRAVLFETSGAGGHKYAISGTATATAIVYDIRTHDLTSQLWDICVRGTALDTAGGEVTGTDHHTIIDGTVTVNAGGTLTVQFAQNSGGGGTSSILVGSIFYVWEMA